MCSGRSVGHPNSHLGWTHVPRCTGSHGVQTYRHRLLHIPKSPSKWSSSMHNFKASGSHAMEGIYSRLFVEIYGTYASPPPWGVKQCQLFIYDIKSRETQRTYFRSLSRLTQSHRPRSPFVLPSRSPYASARDCEKSTKRRTGMAKASQQAAKKFTVKTSWKSSGSKCPCFVSCCATKS